jgi:hypothetical protein
MLGLTIPPSVLAIADEMIEERCCLLQCMSPLLADCVAEVCGYSSEAAASISGNGSHHPLICRAVTLDQTALTHDIG